MSRVKAAIAVSLAALAALVAASAFALSSPSYAAWRLRAEDVSFTDTGTVVVLGRAQRLLAKDARAEVVERALVEEDPACSFRGILVAACGREESVSERELTVIVRSLGSKRAELRVAA